MVVGDSVFVDTSCMFFPFGQRLPKGNLKDMSACWTDVVSGASTPSSREEFPSSLSPPSLRRIAFYARPAPAIPPAMTSAATNSEPKSSDSTLRSSPARTITSQIVPSLEEQLLVLKKENSDLKSQVEHLKAEITDLKRQSPQLSTSSQWGDDKAQAIKRQLKDSGLEKEMSEHEFMALKHFHTKAAEISKLLRGKVTDKSGSQVAILVGELQDQVAVVNLIISRQRELLSQFPLLKSTLSVATEDVKKLLQTLEKAKFSSSKASKNIRELCGSISEMIPKVNISGAVVLDWEDDTNFISEVK
jgi:septal ring factor EnvC (AmiA/AmiB activator)